MISDGGVQFAAFNPVQQRTPHDLPRSPGCAADPTYLASLMDAQVGRFGVETTPRLFQCGLDPVSTIRGQGQVISSGDRERGAHLRPTAQPITPAFDGERGSHRRLSHGWRGRIPAHRCWWAGFCSPEDGRRDGVGGWVGLRTTWVPALGPKVARAHPQRGLFPGAEGTTSAVQSGRGASGQLRTGQGPSVRHRLLLWGSANFTG